MPAAFRGAARSDRGPRRGRRVSVAARGRAPSLQPRTIVQTLQHATQSKQYRIFKEYTALVNDQSQRLGTLRGLFDFRPGATPIPLDEVEPVESDRAALRDRRDVLRLDQPGSARNAGHRDEPAGREVEHRRRRRRPGAVHARSQRRLAAQRDQAGGVGPVRRDERVPRQRRRSADQDGPGRQARRRRSVAGPQGVSVDRAGPPFHAGRHADLAAAASRHLLDRGSRAADLRPQERQPAGARARQARGRGRRRHHRRRRREGACRCRADLRARRRDGRVAAHRASSTAARRGSSAWPRRSRSSCSTSCATGSSCRSTAR